MKLSNQCHKVRAGQHNACMNVLLQCNLVIETQKQCLVKQYLPSSTYSATHTVLVTSIVGILLCIPESLYTTPIPCTF